MQGQPGRAERVTAVLASSGRRTAAGRAKLAWWLSALSQTDPLPSRRCQVVWATRTETARGLGAGLGPHGYDFPKEHWRPSHGTR